MKSIGRIPSTVRAPGCLSEVEEGLLFFVRDAVGTALRLGIRRLGEIASGVMMIDEMVEKTEEAAAQSGDPGVREVIVDKTMERPSGPQRRLLVRLKPWAFKS